MFLYTRASLQRKIIISTKSREILIIKVLGPEWQSDNLISWGANLALRSFDQETDLHPLIIVKVLGFVTRIDPPMLKLIRDTRANKPGCQSIDVLCMSGHGRPIYIIVRLSFWWKFPLDGRKVCRRLILSVGKMVDELSLSSTLLIRQQSTEN